MRGRLMRRLGLLSRLGEVPSTRSTLVPELSTLVPGLPVHV